MIDDILVFTKTFAVIVFWCSFVAVTVFGAGNAAEWIEKQINSNAKPFMFPLMTAIIVFLAMLVAIMETYA